MKILINIFYMIIIFIIFHNNVYAIIPNMDNYYFKIYLEFDNPVDLKNFHSKGCFFKGFKISKETKSFSIPEEINFDKPSKFESIIQVYQGVFQKQALLEEYSYLENDSLSAFITFSLLFFTDNYKGIDTNYLNRLKSVAYKDKDTFNVVFKIDLSSCKKYLEYQWDGFDVHPKLNNISTYYSRIDNTKLLDKYNDTLFIYQNASIYLDSGYLYCEYDDSTFIIKDSKIVDTVSPKFRYFDHYKMRLNQYTNIMNMELIDLNTNNKTLYKNRIIDNVIMDRYEVIDKQGTIIAYEYGKKVYIITKDSISDISDSIEVMLQSQIGKDIKISDILFLRYGYYVIHKSKNYYIIYRNKYIDSIPIEECEYIFPDKDRKLYFTRSFKRDSIQMFAIYDINKGKIGKVTNDSIVYWYLKNTINEFGHIHHDINCISHIGSTYIIAYDTWGNSGYYNCTLFYDSKNHVFFEPKIKWIKVLRDGFKEVEVERYK